MEKNLPYSRALWGLLLAFAATAVASISLQNILIWPTVILFFFAHWKSKQKITWPRGLFAWATLAFTASFFLGALWGVDPANSFRTVFKYLTILLPLPIGAMALGWKEIRKLLLFFTYGAAFCALVGIGKHFFLHEDRISSFSGDKMVFGGMLMAALLFQILFLKDEPWMPWHWVSLASLGWALLLTQTRGAWVGFVAGAAQLLWKLQRKWLLAGAGLLVLCYFLLPPALHERIRSIFDVSMTYSRSNPYGNASQSRLLIWAAGWYMIEDHPWGVGQGNVEKLFPQYRPPVLPEPTEPHLHDNFLQICAQNGWIGLGVYLFWIACYYWTAWRFKPRDIFSGNLNRALLCVFSGVLVWGLTEYTFSHQFMNVQFFLLGLQACLWKNQPDSAETV